MTSDWFAFTGQTMDTASGAGWLEAIHPDDRAYLTRFLPTAHAVHGGYETRYRLKDASGVHRWVHDRGRPRFGADGTFQGYVGQIEVLGQDGGAVIHAFGSIDNDSKMVCIADRLLEARRLAQDLGDGDMLIVLDAALMAVAHRLGQREVTRKRSSAR